MSEERARKKQAVATVPTDAAGSLLNFVAMAVKDPGVDVAKLEALLRMQREIIADDAKTQFNRALHAAQAEIPHIDKLGTVSLGSGKGTYKFATWPDMDKVLRPIMDKHGFTLTFDMVLKEGGGAIIIGTLLHTAGHSKVASIPLALDAGPGRNNLQAMGSTMSYGKRYCAEMLFNLVRKDADDDGRLGGMRFITPDQVAELDTLLTETRSDKDRFLQMFGVATLDNIEAGAWAAARNLLLGKTKRTKA